MKIPPRWDGALDLAALGLRGREALVAEELDLREAVALALVRLF
jgi:hypothetical protein